MTTRRAEWYRFSMNENASGPGASLSAACQEAVEAYRSAGRAIMAPAIRKMLESIIRQKSEHVNELRPLEGAFSGPVPRIVLTDGGDPEKTLASIAEYENAFASTLDGFSSAMSGEDQKVEVKRLADASRKFASWSKDHLDLLALF